MTERIKPGLFHLHRLEGALEFEGSYEQSRVRSQDREQNVFNGFTNRWRQTNRDTRLEETLRLKFDSDVMDPAFLELGGELGLGFNQNRFEEETANYQSTSRDSGYLTTYDLHLNILKTKPVSGTLYGSRSDDRIARRFLPSLREERDSWGTAWFYKSDKFPMRLTYDHRETDRTGNRDEFDDEHLDEDVLRLEGDWLISETQTLKLAYEHGRYQQEYQGSTEDFDTRHDEVSADYELRFGSDKQHTLQAYLRYRPEDGDLARDLFEFNPQLTLQHSDQLSTRYTYQFLQEKYDAIETDTHRGDFQIIHQLFTNLTGTYSLFGLYEKTEGDLQTTQWGAGADFQYNRRNRFGHFRGHFSYNFDSVNFSGDDGLRYINNESGTFRDPLPITLSKQDVILGSIIVTDTSNRRVYLPVQDYVFKQVGSRTTLTRNPTGRLADGETVLIDYLYRTPTDGNLDTHRIDFGVSQEFAEAWTPYYDLQFRRQEENFSTGVPLDEDRLERHRLGLRYRKDRWGASAEYENYDDAIDPYDAFHLRGNLDILREAAHNLDLNAAFSRYFFDGGVQGERSVSLLDISLNHRYAIRSDLAWRLAASYRWEDDDYDGTTNGVDLESGLEYRIGKLTVDLSAEYDLLNIEEDHQDGFGVWLKVRRDLGDLIPRS